MSFLDEYVGGTGRSASAPVVGVRSVPPKPTSAPVPEPPSGDLRRETGIGIPTLLTLAGLAGATALARRPAISSKLESLWQKPLQGLERWTHASGQPSRPVELPYIGVPGLPSELPLLRKKPGSIVTSETERLGANVTRGFHELLGKPFAKETLTQKADVIKDIEHSRVANFLSNMATGMSPSAAKYNSMAAAPQWFREAEAYRASMLPLERRAKRFLGMTPTPERWGPYWAREVIKDESASLRGKRGMFGELKTNVGTAELERKYPTMRSGEQAGVAYDDPRVAWLNRELHSLRLIETANYMGRLENRVVFRTEEAARAAAGLPAGAKVYRLKALPGAPEWFVPYYEEWKFLLDNLRDPDRGKMAFLGSWAQALARNPNLVNPLPHIIKNMAYKYRLAGGKLTQLPADWQEFRQGTSPAVTVFKKVMPFDETGMTSTEMYHRAITGIRRENWPAVARFTDLALNATIGRAHRMSAKVIFSQADPAMRFSLWKQYYSRGMSAEEAAQNVWIDLIRYGTRSTVVDAWKATPFNFFVPWRLGTVTSLYKQLTDHPLRAAMFIGAVDLLREIRYRQTGRWTHLPIDYIETPIAEILQSKDKGDAAKSLIAATLATIFAGPGGAYLFTTMRDVANDIQLRGEWSRLRNMFWGLSQIYDGLASSKEVAQAVAAGDMKKAAEAAGHLLTTAAIAEHSALNYRPRRLMAALPEVGPWLQKSVEVKMAERMQQSIEIRGERKEKIREIFKQHPIEERVKTYMEQRQP